MTRKNAVTVERRGRIATVRFDRGERLNALGPPLIEELTEVARSFENDLETNVIVVTGTRECFSSGADLKDGSYWDPERSALERRHLIHGGGRLCKAWEELPQVTIAAISGLAVGAGCAFALACDWRVMDRDAYFIVPEVRIGMNLQWNTVPRLVSLVGPARAKRITLLCEKIHAPEIFAWGLVDRLSDVPGGSVDLALEWAGIVAEFDPLTVRMVKEAITVTASALDRGLSYADADQSMLGSSLNAALRKVPGKDTRG
jgi:enoyl-CoA hydratase/carnithine racemase